MITRTAPLLWIRAETVVQAILELFSASKEQHGHHQHGYAEHEQDDALPARSPSRCVSLVGRIRVHAGLALIAPQRPVSQMENEANPATKTM